ncbi:tripartite tricarboxylate transporter permease [Pseudomonas typographi]|uniref:Tripartite tricarboxylate transporter permease n=1 Tax=Pseudomonas typographi TaxID=2715964 RepID=A0ABR7Z8I3_9PSED|nr:tripartite tricarboxylate transporter permease [Pseudomonas typographi]MBD1552053.1 tripartite tricarboxylate transporter permease [Pseudomonas typographi]MBD1586617.1 tripartite tricarboxylate transporter permease [Pseudomonas typographi]MBD1601769.1 tripartite tricarboxylate transporter permease [Pseudomonas typographi]
MHMLDNLAMGFGVIFTANNLLYCLFGAILGTLVGILPGLGPAATIAMLLPSTYALGPQASLIMLAGIYYGAQYGGSTTAILVNLPGESSSVVTCLDGHQMALQGRAGQALATAALGSFFAGCFATLLIAAFAPLLSEAALAFGPAEYFSLILLGLIAAVILASGDVLKAIAMVTLGLLLGCVGADLNSNAQRFTFGLPELDDGLDFVAVAMGVFGISEILVNLQQPGGARTVNRDSIKRLWLSREEFKQITWPTIRGTLIGSLLGILPGGGALLGSFASYSIEKKIARAPSRFGKGAIEGVAAPESANNAGAQTSFIPLLTLGIPSNAVMALMVGALMVQGIAPGPQLISEQPALFWGVIASMWVGNAMLIVLNLPLIGIWIRLLSAPYKLLYPTILLICCIGAYSLENSAFSILVVAVFGVLGYVFYLLECEAAPFMLGFILGPLLEEYLRRSLLIARGNPLEVVNHPIALVFLLVSLALVLLILLPNFRRVRVEAFQEE